jgi:energy-coupling factor transporter ATP-binding protein EcfA2
MPLVKFDNFSFKYIGADSLALRKINLTIDEGEYVVITGPSGCGKTTLCRAINGLVPQFHRGYIAGHVYVDSHDTRENEVANLSTIAGMVFQQPENQLVTLNVEKEIAFGPENLGVAPDEIRLRVEEVIHLFDLEQLRHKHPHEMSGGEQQRVALASTLAMKPRILIADEPTSNLDPKSAESILKILSYLNNQGMTIILVEHRLDLVSQDASRIVLMNEGSIVADGNPRDILTLEICDEIGIGVPKATQIYRRLKQHGIILPAVPLSGHELAEFVKEVSQE